MLCGALTAGQHQEGMTHFGPLEETLYPTMVQLGHIFFQGVVDQCVDTWFPAKQI